VNDKTLQKVLNKYNKHTVEYLALDDFKNLSDFILLDAREDDEFEVSHLPGAIHTGFDHFSLAATTQKLPSKQTPIVIYCSIGVRSECIGEQLLKTGYSNVYNLLGGIFSWYNAGNTVIDDQGQLTDRVHTYSKKWSKYLTSGIAVY